MKKIVSRVLFVIITAMAAVLVLSACTVTFGTGGSNDAPRPSDSNVAPTSSVPETTAPETTKPTASEQTIFDVLGCTSTENIPLDEEDKKAAKEMAICYVDGDPKYVLVLAVDSATADLFVTQATTENLIGVRVNGTNIVILTDNQADADEADESVNG